MPARVTRTLAAVSALGLPAMDLFTQLTVYSGDGQLCLDAYGQGTSSGTNVVTWTCNGGVDQQRSLG